MLQAPRKANANDYRSSKYHTDEDTNFVPHSRVGSCVDKNVDHLKMPLQTRQHQCRVPILLQFMYQERYDQS
jgi:hypothetical protein